MPEEWNPEREHPRPGEGSAVPPTTAPALERNAIGLPAVLFQGISTIAPAFGLATGLAFTVSLAGQSAPLVFLIALFFVVVIAVNVGQLAKAFPSAGGFYTYVSRTVHARVDFLTAWVFTLWLPPLIAIAVSYIGFAFVEPELKLHYGIDVPWWVVTVVVAALVTAAAYFGIRASGRALVIAGSIEILVMVAIGVSGFVKAGPGGFNFGPFNPGNSPSLQGLYLGAVFTIFTYSGWETAAPLAEETTRPRRNVQIAVVLSVLLVGPDVPRRQLGNDRWARHRECQRHCVTEPQSVLRLGRQAVGPALDRPLARPDQLRFRHRTWRIQRGHPNVVRHGTIRVSSQAARHGSPAVPHTGDRDLRAGRGDRNQSRLLGDLAPRQRPVRLGAGFHPGSDPRVCGHRPRGCPALPLGAWSPSVQSCSPSCVPHRGLSCGRLVGYNSLVPFHLHHPTGRRSWPGCGCSSAAQSSLPSESGDGSGGYTQPGARLTRPSLRRTDPWSQKECESMISTGKGG